MTQGYEQFEFENVKDRELETRNCKRIKKKRKPDLNVTGFKSEVRMFGQLRLGLKST